MMHDGLQKVSKNKKKFEFKNITLVKIDKCDRTLFRMATAGMASLLYALRSTWKREKIVLSVH